MGACASRALVAVIVAFTCTCAFAARRTGPSSQPSTNEAPAVSIEPVAVRLASPRVRRIMFDPKHPREHIPKLDPDEAGLTQYRFDCRPSSHAQVMDQFRRDDGVEIRAAVRVERIDLALENVIYLPFGATPALRAHEEGHREINERIYNADAERVARRLAEEVMSRSWVGRGPDVESARADAVAAANQHFRHEYQLRVGDRAERVAGHFDQITSHGRTSVKLIDAINDAFANESAESSRK